MSWLEPMTSAEHTARGCEALEEKMTQMKQKHDPILAPGLMIGVQLHRTKKLYEYV